MKRARRSSLDLAGTGSGSAFAAAPSTGEYAKQPTRSSCGRLEKREQLANSASVSPGKADDERAADRDLGADRAPRADALELALARRRALHELQDARARVLERHVEVGQDPALGHQRDDLVDVRIRIDVVQAHPDARASPSAVRELGHARLHRPTVPEAGAVAHVDAVRARVLRDRRAAPSRRRATSAPPRASPRRSAASRGRRASTG